VRDCKRRLLVQADELENVQQAVTSRLLGTFFAEGKTDPLSDLSLEIIEGEVELEVAKFSSIIALACLNSYGPFDPEAHIQVSYVEPHTRNSCVASNHIRSLGKSFPFTPVFRPLGGRQFYVSDAGRLLLTIWAKSRDTPEAQYALASSDAQGQPTQVTSSQLLPQGWGLPAQGG
jgi:hypothetical protein